MPGYGGLRGALRFSVHTAYEAGISRIAEAIHCILGSVTRAEEIGEVAEKNHIEEEIGIIVRYMKEGSGQRKSANANFISPRRLVGQSVGFENPYDEDLARKTVQSIRRNAPKMIATAQRYLREMDGWGLLPGNEKLTRAAYDAVVALGKAAIESVRDWPNSIGNAFKDSRLQRAVEHLEMAVRTAART